MYLYADLCYMYIYILKLIPCLSPSFDVSGSSTYQMESSAEIWPVNEKAIAQKKVENCAQSISSSVCNPAVSLSQWTMVVCHLTFPEKTKEHPPDWRAAQIPETAVLSVDCYNY